MIDHPTNSVTRLVTPGLLRVREYLQFLHLPFHSEAVNNINTYCHGAEVILSRAEPVGEGAEHTLGLFNAGHLLLKLFDRLLRNREGTQDMLDP